MMSSAMRTRGRRAGFTAFEALLAAALLTFITAAVSAALMAGRAQAALASDTVNASMIGQALMEEILRLPTADAQGDVTIGPQSGEIRSTFNSVGDYYGYTDGPSNIADIAGNLYPAVCQGFIRTVAMQSFVSSPSHWGSTVHGILVTVTVANTEGQTLVTLQRVACN